MPSSSALKAKLTRLLGSLREGQATPADLWALARLTPAEGRVYLRLDARDREHACRVTRALLAHAPNSRNEVVAAALLHDCGKATRPYRVQERVLAGLLPHWLMPYVPLGAAQVRLHHPQVGAQMVHEAGGRGEVAALIALHHQPGDNAEARLLHTFDELE